MNQQKITCTWNINISSVIIGFLLATCLILTLGANNPTQNASDGPGPFQVSSAGDLSMCILDTQTGQAWLVGRTETYDYGTPWQRRSVRKSVLATVE